MNGPFKQLTVIGASRGIGLETVELADQVKVNAKIALDRMLAI